MFETGELSQIPGFSAKIANTLIFASQQILARPKKSERPVTVADIQRERLMEIKGVGEFIAKKLHECGYLEPLYVFYEDNPKRIDERASIGFKKSRQLLHAAKLLFRIRGEPTAEILEAHRKEWEERLENLRPPGDEVNRVVDHAPDTFGR